MSYRYGKVKIKKFIDTIWHKEVELSSAKSTGPWWQHINKTETKVQLARDITKSLVLPEPYKSRCIEYNSSYIIQDGVIRFDTQAHRSQAQNKDLARKKLTKMIEKAFKEPQWPRKRSLPPQHAVDARIAEKKRRSKLRANRKTFIL